MRATLILVAFVFAWAALYQGILALGTPPVRDDELVTVSGRLRHVDTPVMRNRLVDQLVLQVETAPARLVMIPATTAALPLEEARALVGQDITVVAAGLRPRNRWVYDLKTATAHLVRLDEQRARDAAARAANIRWMLGLALIAALLVWRALKARPTAD
jgi:hypothetical protein